MTSERHRPRYGEEGRLQIKFTASTNFLLLNSAGRQVSRPSMARALSLHFLRRHSLRLIVFIVFVNLFVEYPSVAHGWMIALRFFFFLEWSVH